MLARSLLYLLRQNNMQQTCMKGACIDETRYESYEALQWAVACRQNIQVVIYIWVQHLNI